MSYVCRTYVFLKCVHSNMFLRRPDTLVCGVAREAGRPGAIEPYSYSTSREAHTFLVVGNLTRTCPPSPSNLACHQPVSASWAPIQSLPHFPRAGAFRFFWCTLLILRPLLLFSLLPPSCPVIVPQDIRCAPLILASRTGPAPLQSINSIK
jgi:hypothetical protein